MGQKLNRYIFNGPLPLNLDLTHLLQSKLNVLIEVLQFIIKYNWNVNPMNREKLDKIQCYFLIDINSEIIEVACVCIWHLGVVAITLSIKS